jgi:hypothetical protein
MHLVNVVLRAGLELNYVVMMIGFVLEFGFPLLA